MHAVTVDCLMPLVNCSRATQDHAAAIQYLQQLLAALETIIGCPNVEVVHLLGLSSRFPRPTTQSSAAQNNFGSWLLQMHYPVPEEISWCRIYILFCC